MAYGAITVPATANGIQIVAKNLSRIQILLYNNSAVTIFLGEDTNVTTSNGYPFLSGREKTIGFNGDADAFPLSYRGAIYGIVATATADLRYWEMLPSTEYT